MNKSKFEYSDTVEDSEIKVTPRLYFIMLCGEDLCGFSHEDIKKFDNKKNPGEMEFEIKVQPNKAGTLPLTMKVVYDCGKGLDFELIKSMMVSPKPDEEDEA